ncbi:divalent metal cation transporter [Luteolibacter algae]|uniref:Divalent metal cation transporter n=1 Tax=Luteolibacter algae TaxID=454151 RepID=A0ABW5DB85_9BACT
MKTHLSKTETELLEQAETKGPLGKAAIYAKLSGPGWLQGAITLGGGSLAGALYLGILFGPHMLWLQPLAMICGVIMLSAITFVTLSTGERPFGLVIRRVSPFLAWAWIIAAAIANLVFCLPQFSLATAAIQQNIAPGTASVSPYVIGGGILAVAALIVSAYNKGGTGVLWFERILKVMVGLIVLSFVGVTITLIAKGAVDFGAVFTGHIPSLKYFTNPTPAFVDAIAQTGENSSAWTEIVTGDHAGKIIAAFGTAVGINMTFLLPYSILKRNWGKRHRGLAIFDLSLGLIVPFVIATGCLVISSASQFYGKTTDVLDDNGLPRPEMQASYESKLAPLLTKIVAEGRAESMESAKALVTPDDQRIAAMLADRDVAQLASSLEPFTGKFLAQKIFGFGVLGMALSTIIMLMLINGFCATEAIGQPDNKTVHFIGAMLPGIIGFFNPAIWTGASKAALAIPASTIAGALIPIAYYTFFLLMNSKTALGAEMPIGGRRIRWNVLMIFATGLVSYGAIWVTYQGVGTPGLKGIMSVSALVVLAILFILGTLGFMKKNRV